MDDWPAYIQLDMIVCAIDGAVGHVVGFEQHHVWLLLTQDNTIRKLPTTYAERVQKQFLYLNVNKASLEFLPIVQCPSLFDAPAQSPKK